ncbi:MAG: hypothetical protein ACKVW3_17395 [Phycisphaerales bacterium]
MLEYLLQLQQLVRQLKLEANHLSAVASWHSPWSAGEPALEIIQRGLQRLRNDLSHAGIDWANLASFLEESGVGKDSDERFGKLYRDFVGKAQGLKQWQQQLVEVTHALNQRSAQQDAPDWHLPVERIERLADIRKHYRAIDAVVVRFMRDVLGDAWLADLERQQWPWMPVVVAGDRYGAELYSSGPSFVRLPKAELVRTRLWPLLAHEVTHLCIGWFRSHRDAKGTRCPEISIIPEDRAKRALAARKELETAITNEVVARIKLDQVDAETQEKVKNLASVSAKAYAEEFMCDAVGLLVAGPAFVWSFATYLGPDIAPAPPWQGAGFDGNHVVMGARAALQAAHPPHGVRLAVLWSLARRLGWGSHLGRLDVDMTGARDLLVESDESGKPKHARNEAWLRVLDVWLSAVDTIADLSLDAAQEVLGPGRRVYDAPRHKQANAIVDGAEPGLTDAAVVLNAGWIKRVKFPKTAREMLDGGPAVSMADRLFPGHQHAVGELFGGLVLMLDDCLTRDWKAIREQAKKGD